MSASPTPYFFVSYSREDTAKQRRIVRELRQRGINIWVDVENLVPGTPMWEREVEKAIRESTGLIVLLSPESNNSEWVRREISFGEQHRKRIFPALIEGDDHTATPLRLASHQRVDLRTKFEAGLDELASALKDYIGIKQDIASQSQVNFRRIAAKPTIGLKKYGLPALIAAAGIACIGSLFLIVPLIGNIIAPTETGTVPPDLDITIAPTTPAAIQDEPTGKIVFTCGIDGDEVCIISPDGSGWRRLTNSGQGSFNASLSPDGKRIVYASGDAKQTEIYEMDLGSGAINQLTDLGKNLGAPEISPDNQYIIFHYRSGGSNLQVWLMDRDGDNPHEFYGETGKDVHDPTWSPDGKQVLFALGKGENNKLYIVDLDGRDPKLVNDSIDTRGRSDWSVNGLISFDQGRPFKHDVYLLNVDGGNLRQVSQPGMNAQGASISPDGNWIAFTAYTNAAEQDQNSCEIFIMRVDGTDVRQLTDNEYCDYQPRWGN
jgi:hypothetical protein